MKINELKEKAVLWERGNLYEDFEVGQAFTHHWGRTITEGDTVNFSVLTMSYNPMYTNREYAKAHGHPDLVVNPLLVFNTVLGLSVEDCSEIGGPFLGVFELTYHKPVYPGDTITATTETYDKRITDSNPNNGVVSWHHKGFNQNGEMVIDFKRSNLMRRRNPQSEA